MSVLELFLVGLVVGHCLYLLCYALGWFSITGTPYADHIENSLKRYTKQKEV